MKKCRALLIILICIFVAGLVPTVSADGPIEGRNGRAELRFLEGMIDHHQMAIDMANDCLTKAQTEAVLTLCQNVIDAQSAEIATMQGWLQEWYGIEYSPMSMMSGDMDMMGMMDMMSMMEDMSMEDMMDMQGMMEGMDMANTSMMDMMNMMMEMHHSGEDMEAMHSEHMGMMGMMAGLANLEGVEYEIAWLEAMIDHHDDALHMSERILEREVHPETAEMAQQIIADQTAEIEEMEALITELGG